MSCQWEGSGYSMKTHHTSETYIEAIYVLGVEGNTVIAARLADYLSVARPTVTQMVKRLIADGSVVVKEGKVITLTEQGQSIARSIIRRHRLLERWLTDVLGLDWGTAHVEASRLEQAISPLIESRLEAVLGFPATCPHGNAIPGREGEVPFAVPLSTVKATREVEVVRIFEQVEEDVELLRYLERTGFVPSRRVRVVPGDQYAGACAVEVSGEKIALSPDVAERIMVRVVEGGDVV